MALTAIQGVVSAFHERRDQRNNVTQVSASLRIGSRPASMKAEINLSDGDVVTAAGKDSPDFRILALRNETTDVQYSEVNPTVHKIVGWGAIVMGALLSFLIFPPLFLIPMGCWILWDAGKVKRALTLLNATPRVAQKRETA